MGKTIRKMIAATALVLIMSTAVVSAAVDLITNFNVSKTTFDPSNGETVNFNYNLNETNKVYAYMKPMSGEPKILLKSYVFQQQGSQTITWNGRDNYGNTVKDGEYVFELFVYKDGSYLDNQTESIMVKTVPVTPGVAPNVTSLVAVPAAFNPTNNETTNISFNVNTTADLFVEVINSGNQVVRTFSSYNGDSYTGQSHSVSWNGKNNSGNIVSAGLYTVKVTAENSLSNDTEVTTVSVVSGSGGNGDGDAPTISSLNVSPKTFDPKDGEDTDISFFVDKTARLTVTVSNGNSIVKTFSNYSADSFVSKSHVLTWNGRNDSGNVVADGTYIVSVRATNDKGSDSKTATVVVDSDGTTGGGDLIKNLDLNPSGTWDPTDEELEITFDVIEDDVDIEVIAKKGSTTVDIFDDNVDEEDNFEVIWDGEDEDGDLIDEGFWTIIVKADGEQLSETIKVEYETTEISDAFVTKENFDNEIDEFTHLVFRLDDDALATVQVFKGSKEVNELWDEVEVEGDKWYAVKFDGTDEDGDELSESSNYKFKLIIKDEDTEKTVDTEFVTFEIEEDDVSSSVVNVTNDFTDPVIFDEDDHDEITFNFCLDDDDSEVTLLVYSGKSASGTVKAEVLDDEDYDKGCHTFKWEPETKSGKDLSDGVYSYKLTSADGSKKDNEVARFVIGEAGKVDGKTPKPPVSGDCGGFTDTKNLTGELCEAIDWVRSRGIFTGHPDGSFRPYEVINRAEALKVSLETFDATLLPATGTTLGFVDVDPNAWYMTYVRTGKFYALLHGYLNQTEARLFNNVNRVEFLKFVFEAMDALTAYEYPGHPEVSYIDLDKNSPSQVWFWDYAGEAFKYNLYNAPGSKLNPAQFVQRGEAALLLYRLHKAGLID